MVRARRAAARRAAAPEAAKRFFVRAIELLPDEPGLFNRRVQQIKGLWDMQWWQAMYSEALETGKTLLAAAEAHADPSAQAAAWNRIAAVQNRLADHQPALYSVQRAERLARAAGASQELVLALFNRGVTLFGMGNSAGALKAGEKALAFNQSLLEAGGDNQSARDHTARESARIINLLAMIHQRAGRYTQAELDYRKVLESIPRAR